MEELFVVHNDGPKIDSTNYWSTGLAIRGLAAMSINAGCYRLLLPDSFLSSIPNMVVANEVVITRGTYKAKGMIDAFEVMFDDGSKSPYVLLMDNQVWDNLPAESDQGWHGTLEIYTRDLAQKPTKTFPVYYRRGNLPNMKPAKH